MFFPVSSTSHLVLAQHWFKLRNEGFPDPDGEAMIFFNLMVYVGTLVSIVVIFRRPLWQWWHGLRADLSRLLSGSAPLADRLVAAPAPAPDAAVHGVGGRHRRARTESQ